MGRKLAKEIGAAQLGSLSPGFHSVGVVQGLMLQVTPSGNRSWVLRMSVGGRRRDMGLGPYPSTTLADAREAARKARESLKAGADPIEQRRAAVRALAAEKAMSTTFEQCAADYIAANAAAWTNSKHAAQWTATLETYAYPSIGPLPVGAVETRHVEAILKPIWNSKTETATRVRGRIEAVLDRAKVLGMRTGDNPARWRGHLDHLLPAPRKVTKIEHHPAMPWQDMPKFWPRLRSAEGMGARALEFAILCASRSAEVRLATWSEFDMAAKIWTVPAERMKARKEHRVPLSDTAVERLCALPQDKPGDLVFPGAKKGAPLSDMSLSAVLRRMELACVPHGFRSTFRDWASEQTNYATAVCEQALAHSVGSKTEQAYHRTDLFDKRRALMADWSAFVTTAP